MIYEFRTYDLKPHALGEYEARFAEALPHREKYSKMWAFWHTEVGMLNQVIHVWTYDDLGQRTQIRAEAAKDPNWPPQTGDVVLNMESEILIPAPFMRPETDQQLGNIYELRTYTYKPATIPEVVKRWTESIPHREKYSPMAGCWYSELGGLNKWFHLWAYKDMTDRDRVRAEAVKDPHWPPDTEGMILKMENKIMVPASFSRMK